MASALTYAVDHGARVINVSFYGTTSSTTLQSAADYVWSHNGIIFACAGNTGTSAPTISGGLPKCDRGLCNRFL